MLSFHNQFYIRNQSFWVPSAKSSTTDIAIKDGMKVQENDDKYKNLYNMKNSNFFFKKNFILINFLNKKKNILL